jgi:hypothetical protein
MKQAREIINTLSNLGVTICAQGENLAVVPKNKVPADLVEELRQHKSDILALLSSACTCNPLPSQAKFGALAQAGCGPKYERCHTCRHTRQCKICGGCRQCRSPGRKVKTILSIRFHAQEPEK